MSDKDGRASKHELVNPDEYDGAPDMDEVDWGPTRLPLEDGDPCPECGYEFDSDEWDERYSNGGPTIGEDWYYTCPNCEQETCWIGT
jgi:hypothetical protein